MPRLPTRLQAILLCMVSRHNSRQASSSALASLALRLAGSGLTCGLLLALPTCLLCHNVQGAVCRTAALTCLFHALAVSAVLGLHGADAFHVDPQTQDDPVEVCLPALPALPACLALRIACALCLLCTAMPCFLSHPARG